MSIIDELPQYTSEFIESLGQVMSPKKFTDLPMSLCEQDTKNVICTACLLGGKYLPHEAAARILANRERMLKTGNAFQRSIAVPDLDGTPTVGELLFFGALHCASWLLEYPEGPAED